MYPGFTCGLFVTLVDACNINCSFCPFPPKKDFRSGGVLDYEKFLKMLSSLKTNPPSIPLGAVSFCGSGEPLLYKRLTELVAETTKRVPQVSLVTNGLLLNESTAKELIKSNINHIVISITGDTSEVYNHYQGNGQSAEKAKSQLELVRHNVKQLVKIRDKSKGITQIGISYILHEDSKKDLFSALNYYNSIGINYTDIRIRSDGFSLTGDDFEEYVAENRTKFDTQGGGRVLASEK
jgi:MoaA/NifB/PqqE/SkfB family radical SAM enzyme